MAATVVATPVTQTHLLTFCGSPPPVLIRRTVTRARLSRLSLLSVSCWSSPDMPLLHREDERIQHQRCRRPCPRYAGTRRPGKGLVKRTRRRGAAPRLTASAKSGFLASRPPAILREVPHV